MIHFISMLKSIFTCCGQRASLPPSVRSLVRVQTPSWKKAAAAGRQQSVRVSVYTRYFYITVRVSESVSLCEQKNTNMLTWTYKRFIQRLFIHWELNCVAVLEWRCVLLPVFSSAARNKRVHISLSCFVVCGKIMKSPLQRLYCLVLFFVELHRLLVSLMSCCYYAVV